MEVKPELVDKLRNLPIVFILGLGRSGTTLLQTMLDSHPNVVAPPESKFIILLYPRFHGIKKWSEKDIHDFADALYLDPLFVKLWSAVDKDKLIRDMISIREHADYAMYCKLVCYHMRENKENITMLTFKVPLYTIFISKLLRMFPDTRFIHMVRDPRDNLYSHIKSYNLHKYIFVNQQWLGYNSLMEKYKKLLPEKFFSVQYEQLVNDLERNMKALSGFLGIPYNPAMLHQKIGKFKNDEDFKKIHESLLSSVNTSNIGKWRTKLSEEDIAVTETITGEMAKQYGYELTLEPGKIPVSKFQILRSRYLYIIWKQFTFFRYSSLRINKLYSRIMRSKYGDKLPIWNYF